MGAMSINFSVQNEMYLREQAMNWGNRSPIVNKALDAWRAKRLTVAEAPGLGELVAANPRQALTLAMSRISLRMKGESAISAKDRGRITRALNQALYLMDEFMIEQTDREVIE